MSDPETVSVVIVARNAGAGFEANLQAIRGQVVPGRKTEILVVDSGSTDDTPGVALRNGARVLRVPQDSFNHGRTRNAGVDAAGGAIVALLVQDARPAGANWLAPLVSAVESDANAAGAYSRQLPWPADDALTVFLVHQWHRLQGERRVVQRLADGATLLDLPYDLRRRLAAFDNVSSVVRRDVWERHRFREVRFAEDMDWCRRVLEDGYAVVYEPESTVFHSHVRPFSYNARRQYVDELVLMDLLEADDAAIRRWSGPVSSVALVRRVLSEARRDGTWSVGLVRRTTVFALAVTTGSLARRAVHPELRGASPPRWARRIDAWFTTGV